MISAAHVRGAGELRWFAVAAPGLEDVLLAELRALAPAYGLRELARVAGGVELVAPLAGGFGVNLGSRIATRVLVRAGEVKAREFALLRRRLSRIAFEHFLDPRLPVRIDVSTRGCRLYHTAAIAESVLLAAGERLGTPLVAQRTAHPSEPEPEPDAEREATPESPAGELPFGLEPFARVLVRGERDAFVISVDGSGLLLHRRGGRAETGRAPLRETLAAGILALAGYTGEQPLVNAMCGAGTIVLEAAAVALQRAPGRARSFALEHFADCPRQQLAALRARAAGAERAQPPAPLFAFDRDPAAVERARRNAERAGVAHAIQLQVADFAQLEPPCAGGLLVANPPYGRRLGSRAQAARGIAELVRGLRARYRGFAVALLVPRESGRLGLRGERRVALHNGGIPVTLVLGEA